MENASKALIIAGAILLSILLISLGIMVYNNAKGTIGDANLDAETAQAFNTKITQYCGTKKNAATMSSLVDAIIASNGAQNGKANAHTITVTASGTGVSGTSPNFSFDNTATYTATYTTDANGYITTVTIVGA